MPEQPLLQDSELIRLNDQDEIQQILGHPPGWILRWGITVLIVVVLVLLLVAWLVKYPDVIPAPVVITTENPSIRVVARTDGKIQQLEVEDQEMVEAGTLLGVLENPAELADIRRLEELLQTLPATPRELPTDLRLGSLQSRYAALAQKLADYHFFLAQSGPYRKMEALSKQIEQLAALNQAIERQAATKAEEVELAQQNKMRYAAMTENGTVSREEAERIEGDYLSRKSEWEGLLTQIYSNEVRIEQLRAEIIDLEQALANDKAAKQFSVSEDLQGLYAELQLWKQTYLLQAPIKGRVSFAQFWSPMQFVQANQEVLTIVPPYGSGRIEGRAFLPLSRSGKVKPNDRVHIRLDGYPYQEYGSLLSRVGHISLVPEGEAYVVQLPLPDSLVTTYGKRIPFRPEMQGTAQIITEERRIAERIYDRLLSAFKNR